MYWLCLTTSERLEMRKAWVVGAYGNNGGNHMNYHIAKVCKDILNLETYAISLDTSLYRNDNIFGHEQEFKEYSLKEFEAMHEASDILISNPSFSIYLLGYRARCKKIMYVQHFNTYRRLDLKFDHYVSVSKFVRQYLNTVYNIDSSVISAFTETPLSITPFESKKGALLVYSKNRQARLNYFNKNQKSMINMERIDYLEGLLNRNDFLSTIDSYKYFLSLSIDEGFGLVTLEAMNRGLVVFGFDGYGSRDFMIRAYNCMTNKYPDWETVNKSINKTVTSKKKCLSISQNAILTASSYSLDKFEKSWIQVLRQHL